MSASRESWVETVASLLRDGPLGPEGLARGTPGLQEFGKESPEFIASLLGPDPRFRLDSDGRWHLNRALAGARSSLGFLDYAVVDVETTGGAYEAGHRIIELAIVELREGVVNRELPESGQPGTEHRTLGHAPHRDQRGEGREGSALRRYRAAGP